MWVIHTQVDGHLRGDTPDRGLSAIMSGAVTRRSNVPAGAARQPVPVPKADSQTNAASAVVQDRAPASRARELLAVLAALLVVAGVGALMVA
jgi:hypothetical protein